MTDEDYKIVRNYELAQVIGLAIRQKENHPEHASILLKSAQNVWSFFNPKRTILERSQNPDEN